MKLFRILLLVLLCLTPVAAAVAAGAPPPGLTRAEALRLGEQMYRRGLLPSGAPMEATVQGDIPVDGTMFSCQSCHLRSGVGSIEGSVITLPTNATELFKPFTKAAEEALPAWQGMPAEIRTSVQRPAYDAASLGRVLTTGVDPGGRELDPIMPRYRLAPPDLAILVYYLENLSARFSPGVDATTLHLATVVTPGIDPVARDTMLAILRAQVADRNSQSRLQEQRAQRGAFYKKKVTTAYRRLDLRVWELKGPRESWPAQLEAWYRRRPVFALVGGMASGSWRPIHDFCETHRLPELLPLTEFPVISDSDWYTLYFSKGWYQEGETLARYLARSTPRRPILQVLRDTPKARALAAGLNLTAAQLGLALPRQELLPVDTRADAAFWQDLHRRHPGAQLVLWLERSDLTALGAWPGTATDVLYLSWRLAGLAPGETPPLAERLRFTYPWRMPEQRRRTESVVDRWLRIRHIEPTGDPLDDQVYYIGWLLTGILNHVRSDFYRDYFFDCVDMMNDEVYAAPLYPRLSFGPGQRYAAKGCYLVRLGHGDEPRLVPVSDWIIH